MRASSLTWPGGRRGPEAVGVRLMYDLEWLEQVHAAGAIPTGETRGRARLW